MHFFYISLSKYTNPIISVLCSSSSTRIESSASGSIAVNEASCPDSRDEPAEMSSLLILPDLSGKKKKKKSSDFDIEADEQIDQHIDRQNDSSEVECSSQSHNRRGSSRGRKKKHSKSKGQKSGSINKEDISAGSSLESGQDASLTAIKVR
jgi:hypothetical protein